MQLVEQFRFSLFGPVMHAGFLDIFGSVLKYEIRFTYTYESNFGGIPARQQTAPVPLRPEYLAAN